MLMILCLVDRMTSLLPNYQQYDPFSFKVMLSVTLYLVCHRVLASLG